MKIISYWSSPFLIINEKQSYYLINYLEPQNINVWKRSTNDRLKITINAVNENISKLKEN